MKKRILLLTLLLCSLLGCKYDDGPILDKVNDLEGRVSRLEVACGKLNQDLVALQKVVTLLQNNDYVTSVTPLMEQGQQVGYTLTFAKGGPVSIRDGKNGLNGKDGTNGTNGKDGHTPALGVKADSDGIYYWTVDGEWLLTADGQKVRAEGRDGKNGADGQDGTNGKDGQTPAIGVKADSDGIYYWTINGEWLLGADGQKVKAEGRDGKNGADGQDGTNGKDGHTPVIGVKADVDGIYYWTIDGEWMIGTDGQKVKAEGRDGKNGAAGQDGTNGKDGHTPVIGVKADVDGIYYWTIDGEWLLGADGRKVKAEGRDGKDGADGQNGVDGQNGADGQDGKDGHTPVIGVKADVDGVYYWTINGEWLLNSEGQKVRAEGRDGKNGVDGQNGADGQKGSDGQKGADGKDGITPQLKIEDEYWYVSTDNGVNWQKLGRAVSAGYTSPIKEVKVEDDRILLTLASGEEIAVPRVSPNALRIEAPDSKEIDFRTTHSFSIDYRIVNGTAPTLLRVEVSNGLKVVTPGQQRDGLGGRLVLTVIPSEEVTGMVLIKVCDAKGKEAVKVVTLTHKAKDPTGTISDDQTPILFKDQSVKSKLLPICDSDANGEISYAEASRVKELPKVVFKGTSIKSFDELQYFTSLKSIPNFAFQDCEKLESVVIPKGVTSIGVQAFEGCRSLASVVIREGVVTIGREAFGNCKSLTSVVIPEGATTIGEFAFANCSELASIVIPKGVTTIGECAFRFCSSLSRVVIPEGVTTLDGVFAECGGLTSVVIPKGVTTIGSSAFRSCSGLTNIVIPEGVTSIHKSAFEYCTGLKTMKLPSTLKDVAKGAFDYVPKSLVYIVPRGYAAVYQSTFLAFTDNVVEE